MLTKAIIQSIDYTKNICRVRIPLFENASRNTVMIEADAQFSIVPGVYNSYKTGDIVFISFEENKMELPVILGKLFVSASAEASSHRGNLSGNSLDITDTAQLPYSTVFDYSNISRNSSLYKNLNTPKKLADSIIDLQQSSVQKYQTVLEVAVQENLIYNLYLKTASDFTYTPDKSDEPLYRLCTGLKNSHTENTVIPLEFALEVKENINDFGETEINYTTNSHQALLRIQESTSSVLTLEVVIDGISYVVTKDNIRQIQSQAISY